jgi:hypothetical protein
MWARNREGIGFSYRPVRLHTACGIGFLESILGLLKSLKLLALISQSLATTILFRQTTPPPPHLSFQWLGKV